MSYFNLNYFRRLVNKAHKSGNNYDYTMVHFYAGQRLKEIGDGANRTVYRLNANQVLKVENRNNEDFSGQNANEIYISKTYDRRNRIFTRVIKYDRKHFWLIAEYAKKINSQQFKDIAGFSFSKRKIENPGSNKFAQELLYFANKYEMYDFKLSNFGLYRNKIVLVDYGFCSEKQWNVNSGTIKKR